MAFPGAEQVGLLLRPTDEQHPLRAGELGQVFVHHIVFASPLSETNPRQLVIPGKAVHRRTERISDLRQQCRRSDRQPQLPLQIADQPRRELQLQDIDVQIHPVDTLHLQAHVLGQDIGDRSRYGHDGLRTEMGRPLAN